MSRRSYNALPLEKDYGVNTMEYHELDNALEHYNDLFQKGLKKQANKYIEDFSGKIEAIAAFEQERILYRFVSGLCDDNKYDFLKERGNGRIPFALEQYVKKWLYNRCAAGRMPELRWFYELFHSDRYGVEYAYDFLEKAYESNECDSKTVNLLFDSHLRVLGWGAHHFPASCIITDAAKRSAFGQCRKIMGEKAVDEKLQAQLKYYEILYSCYDRYNDDGKKADFEQYCAEANIRFYETKAFYYKK